MKTMETILRFLLTVELLYLSYGETGIWTTLVLSLIVINNEIQAYVLSRNKEFYLQ